MHVSAVRVFVVKGLLLLQITIIYDDFLESFKYFRPLFQSQNPESGRRSIPGFRDPKCCPDRNPIVAVRTHGTVQLSSLKTLDYFVSMQFRSRERNDHTVNVRSRERTCGRFVLGTKLPSK